MAMQELALLLKVVDQASGGLNNVKSKVEDLGDSASGSTHKLSGLGNLLSGGLNIALGVVAAGFATATAAVSGFALAGITASSDFDNALDAIIIATGASGASLDAMGESARRLKTSTAGVGHDFQTIGAVMGEVNTRTGLTGEALESLTGTILTFSRLTGGDAVQQTQLLTRVMGDWGIQNEDAAGTLDMIFGAGQAFGIGVDDLAAKVVQFGAPLRQMGFTLEESAAMFGKWEREGVNAELVIGSLRIAAGNFAEQGVDLTQGLRDAQEAIRGAATDSEALTIAMQIFGARAGPDMAAAIREGRFELDSAIEALRSTEGGLERAGNETLDFKDRWELNMNRIRDAMIPFGTSLLDAADRLMPSLTRAIENLTPFIQNMGDRLGAAAGVLADLLAMGLEEGFSSLFTVFADGSTHLDAFFTALGFSEESARELSQGIINGSKALATFGRWVARIVGAVSDFVTQMGGMEFVLRVIGALFATKIIVTIALFATKVVSVIGAIGSFIGALSGIGATVAGVIAAITPIGWVIIGVVAAIAALYVAWQNNFLGIRDIVAVVWEAISNFFSGVGEFLSGFSLSSLTSMGANAMTAISSGFESAKEGVRAAFSGALTWVQNNLNWTSISTAIREGGQTAFAKISEGFEAAKNTGKAALEAALNWVQQGSEGTLPPFQQKIFNWGQTGLNEARRGFDAAKPVASAALGSALEFITNIDFTAIGRTMLDIGRRMLESLGSGIINATAIVQQLIAGAVQAISDIDLGASLEQLRSLGSSLLNTIWRGVTDVRETIRQRIIGVFGFITDFPITEYLEAMRARGTSLLNRVLTGVTDVMGTIRQRIIGVFSFITDFPIAEFLEAMRARGSSLLNKVLQGALDVAETIRTRVASVFSTITSFDLGATWERMRGYGATLFNNVWTGVTDVVSTITTRITETFSRITGGNLADIWIRMRSYGSSLFNYVWTGVTDVASTITTRVTETFSRITGGNLADIWARMRSYGSSLFNYVWTGVTDIWERIKSNVVSAFSFITGIDLGSIWTRMRDFGTTLFENVWAGITNIWERIKSNVASAFSFITGIDLGSIWTRMRDFGTALFNYVWTGVTDIWDRIKTNVSNAFSFITGIDLGSIWTRMRDYGTTLLNNVWTGITNIWEDIKTKVASALSFITNLDLSNIWIRAKVWGENILQNIWTGITNIWENIKQRVASAIAFITGLDLNNIWDRMKDIGRDLLRSIGDGIEQAKDWLRSKVQGVANLLPQWLKDWLGMHSPSPLFVKIGQDIDRSLALGIGSGAEAENAVRSVARSMVAAGQGQVATTLDQSTTYNWNVTMPGSGATDTVGQVGSLVNQLTAIYA